MRIEDMMAGPELDYLIDEKIFGKEWPVYSLGGQLFRHRAPTYSTEGAGAFEVMEFFEHKDRGVTLAGLFGWTCTIMAGGAKAEWVEHSATTPRLAVCRAALAAIGYVP